MCKKYVTRGLYVSSYTMLWNFKKSNGERLTQKLVITNHRSSRSTFNSCRIVVNLNHFCEFFFVMHGNIVQAWVPVEQLVVWGCSVNCCCTTVISESSVIADKKEFEFLLGRDTELAKKLWICSCQKCTKMHYFHMKTPKTPSTLCVFGAASTPSAYPEHFHIPDNSHSFYMV